MTDVTVSSLILDNLAINFDFTRQSLPYIDPEYFESRVDQAIFNCLGDYFTGSGALPNKNVLLVEINDSSILTQAEIEEAKERIHEMYQSEPEPDNKWLLSQAETWCQERAMYLSIVKAIGIYDGSNKELNPHAIPEMMKQALAVSFKTNIGSDWVDDAEERFERYQKKENKIRFDLDTLNDITLGGITKKTFSVILAGVHVGKTMSLCHLTAGYARLGYNVVYFSMEMDEDAILQRIDANMLKTSMHKIEELGKDPFMRRIDYLRAKNYGKIKVIQFPTGTAHAGHFRNVLNEMHLKQGFKPDIVMVDYVGIVASSRLKIGSTNSHFYLKSVAEELRAMAIEMDFAVWSAMQLTRSGMSTNDVEMTDIAESIGIPGVCDFMLAGTRNEDMDALGQIAFKQLKNRFRQIQYRPRFVLGCVFEQQLLYDVSESEQDLIVSTPSKGFKKDQSREDREHTFSTPSTQARFDRGGLRLRSRNVKIDVGDYDS